MDRRPDLHPTPVASAAFAERVGAARPERGMAVWSLGGSGVLIKGAGASVAIDPYLSNRLGDLDPDAPPGWRDRSGPAPVLPADLTGLTAVLVTHGHGDHFDPATLGPLLAANPRAEVVLPHALAEDLADLGVDPARVSHPVSGRREERVGWSFEAVPSAHAPPDSPALQPDGRGGHDHVGYLVQIAGARLYHAGDTIVYEGLVDRLRGRVDAAVLPINGRRWAPFQPARRGNMGYEEAADLAAVLGARTLLAVHHELIGSSARPVEPLLEYAARVHPELELAVLSPGQRLDVVAGTSARAPVGRPRGEPSGSAGRSDAEEAE